MYCWTFNFRVIRLIGTALLSYMECTIWCCIQHGYLVVLLQYKILITADFSKGFIVLFDAFFAIAAGIHVIFFKICFLFVSPADLLMRRKIGSQSI